MSRRRTRSKIRPVAALAQHRQLDQASCARSDCFHRCAHLLFVLGACLRADFDRYGPSYQVPLARAVKQAVKIPVVAVGLITDYEQAEAIVGTGDADLVALARAILYDPRWPWHAAAHLGGRVRAPEQYLRSQPRQYRALFDLNGSAET